MTDLWIRFRVSLAERGLRHTLESALSVPQDYLFDFVNGTDTARRLRQPELGVVSEHAEGAQDYVPTRGRACRKLMHRLDLPEDSVFVDFGSGKGKILLLASQLGFRSGALSGSSSRRGFVRARGETSVGANARPAVQPASR